MITKKMTAVMVVLTLFILIGNPTKSSEKQSSEIGETAGQDTISSVLNQLNLPPDLDSLLVIHFHPEVQCSCCISVGNFARKALERSFTEQCRNSVLIFKAYNIDEDTLTAEEYKIFWSALGFEKFYGEKKEFKEIESVWEFCENEEKFLSNFKKELDLFIIGSEKSKSEDQDTSRSVAKPIWKKKK